MLLIAVYFCRLKINQDSHEFILESGTVANTKHIHVLWRMKLSVLFKQEENLAYEYISKFKDFIQNQLRV
jgi:hypothetical protein